MFEEHHKKPIFKSKDRPSVPLGVYPVLTDNINPVSITDLRMWALKWYRISEKRKENVRVMTRNYLKNHELENILDLDITL